MNEIKSKITMDLQKKLWQETIDVVQDDRNMRTLEITLTADGANWVLPGDASVLIRYLKADGTGGEYDTLADGSAAWRASGNVLTVILAPQVMTVSGPVRLWVTLIRGEKQISSFGIGLNVTALSDPDRMEEPAFANIAGYLPAPGNAVPGQYLRITSVDARNHVTGIETVAPGTEAVLHSVQTLTEEQQCQARANIGAAPAEAVLYEQQTLTEVQRNQARANIGAAPAEAVLYEQQALTEAQQTRARANIGAAPAEAVLYEQQALTEAQQTRARANIGAAPAEAVLYEQQTLTETQQSQARANIGAAPAEAVLYEQQALTEAQRAQARENIGAMAPPATAFVGQTIVVLETDSQGVPVRWAAANMPEMETWTFTLEGNVIVEKKVAVFA